MANYGSQALMQTVYGNTLMLYAFDLDNTGTVDPVRVSWALDRADEVLNDIFNNSAYIVPLTLVPDDAELVLIPDWASRIAFIRAYMTRGGEMEKGQRTRYGREMKCIIRAANKVVTGTTQLNAVLDSRINAGPIGD